MATTEAREPEWMTLPEAMAYLRASRSKIYRLMEGGVIVGYKLGATWRFRRSELRQAVEGGTREGAGGSEAR